MQFLKTGRQGKFLIVSFFLYSKIYHLKAILRDTNDISGASILWAQGNSTKETTTKRQPWGDI